MIHMLIVTPKKEEAAAIVREAKEQAALMTQDRWEIRTKDRLDAEEERQKGLLDIAYMDAAMQNGIKMAEQIRTAYRNVYLVLIVSAQQSPVSYLKPSVMAASVLLRPLEAGQVRENIREAIRWLPDQEEAKEEMLIIAERDGKLRIPFRRILYFEAREKKIFAALETEEYGFYDSMERLSERLPDFFCRCHRGFIVNTRYMKKIQPGSNICLLQGGIEIPVSRSYKPYIREYFSE